MGKIIFNFHIGQNLFLSTTVPQTVCNMRLDTLEEWYQESNVGTILLTYGKH